MKNYKVFLTILNFLQNPEKFYYISLINFHFSFCEWVDIFLDDRQDFGLPGLVLNHVCFLIVGK